MSVADAAAAIRRWMPEANVSFAPDAARYKSILHVASDRFVAAFGYRPPTFEDRVRDQMNEARAERRLPPLGAG